MVDINTLDLNDRHSGAIKYAEAVLTSELGNKIDKVILYGSCATGRWKYSSDVDLMVIVNTIDFSALKLRGQCMPDDLELAEVDVHFISREDYEVRDDTYIKNIKREGVCIYERTK